MARDNVIPGTIVLPEVMQLLDLVVRLDHLLQFRCSWSRQFAPLQMAHFVLQHLDFVGHRRQRFLTADR